MPNTCVKQNIKFVVISMYFDVEFREYIDENGVKHTEPIPVVTPPDYPSITPEDMSIPNQLKAGAQLKQVKAKSGDKLSNADAATQSLIQNGENIQLSENVSEPIPAPSPEPSPEPKSE